MKVRLATIDDVEKMSKVVVDTWKVAYKGLISQAYLNKLTSETYNERFKRQLYAKKLLFLVAEVQGKIVGMLQANVIDEEMRIDMLYVSPVYQKNGIGKALLDKSIKDNTSVQKVVLDVLDKNMNAKLFYEQQGFFPTGKKRKSEINAGVFLVERFERLIKES